MKQIIKPCNILLPKKNVDMEKWAVVACDQYTSEKEYWEDVEKIVGDEPSTYRIIYPEVYLNESSLLKEQRLKDINKKMESYVQDYLNEYNESMILIDRVIGGKHRIGVVCGVDLEYYDYVLDNQPEIRATEKTITDRIPPRLAIRKDAIIETPHILIVINDKKKEIVEELYNKKDQFELLYSTKLMKNGGYINGYLINDKEIIDEFNDKIVALKNEGISMLVGDGNHSLATAKAHWNSVKANLDEKEISNHPARVALVEVNNIYDEGLNFLPIHRVIFGNKAEIFIKQFKEKISGENELKLYKNGEEICVKIPQNKIEAVKQIQDFVEEFISVNKDVEVDYIYGEQNLKDVCDNLNGLGIIMNCIDKSELFPYIEKGNVLPKKTFSIGEAYEKKYYIECKKIIK